MSFAEHPVGSVCWLDLGVVDTNTAASFYGELFGWKVTEPDETGYRLASLDGQLVAAFGPADDPGPPYWTVYVRTADISASLDAVFAAGGTIVVPATPAGDAGVAAVVRDPQGGPLSFWQPGTHRGTYVSGHHGTFAGVQVNAPDQAFLGAALGWQVQPDSAITHAGRTVATWVSASAGPSPWLIGFHVADVSAAVARAVRAGARVVGEGAAVLRDPAGALFELRSI